MHASTRYPSILARTYELYTFLHPKWDFEQAKWNFEQAKQDFEQAKSNYLLI